MTPPVVAVAGLSGVGKSTLLSRLKRALPMQILQASALIKEERAFRDGQNLALDALREADLDENQRLLAQGFARRIYREASLVALDCHTIVETPSGLIRIDPCVFEFMSLRAMVFLEDEPEQIARRRRNDATRNGRRPKILGRCKPRRSSKLALSLRR